MFAMLHHCSLEWFCLTFVGWPGPAQLPAQLAATTAQPTAQQAQPAQLTGRFPASRSVTTSKMLEGRNRSKVFMTWAQIGFIRTNF